MSEKRTDRWDKVDEIWRIIEKLRSESGCPWDRKQTPETIQTYLVEESHEAAAAVRMGRRDEVADELGDTLFMVLFLIYLYEEQGDFDMNAVCGGITEKMIRRHPHVFGGASVASADEVKDSWEKIKAGEKKSAGKVPEPVPESLPALMRAHRMLARLSWDEGGALNDLAEQEKEFSLKSRKLRDAIGNARTAPPSLIGDMLLQLVNIARIGGIRAEDLLHERLRKLE